MFLGFLDVVLSRALLRGFVAAVAVVIAVCMVTSSFVYLTSHSPSKQLIPMFGLVGLENQLQPETTLDKIIFLIKNVWSHAHQLTTIVSFGALLVLMLFHSFKTASDQWRPVTDSPDVEDIPGALIVRIRESLDFGACCHKIVRSTLTVFISQHLSAQRQVLLSITRVLTHIWLIT